MNALRILLCALPPLLFSTAAPALERIGIALGDIQGEGWQAHALSLSVDLPAAAEPGGDIAIGELVLPDPLGSLGAVKLRCDTLRHDARGTRCSGRVEIARFLGEPLVGQVNVDYLATSGRVQIELQHVRLAGGQWRLGADYAGGRWRVRAQGRQVDAAAAREFLQPLVPDFAYTLAGRVDLAATLDGTAATLDGADVTLVGTGVDFANAGGTQAGEQLNFSLSGRLQRRGADWQGDARLELRGGALFVDPLYVEPTPQSPLQLASRLRWAAAPQRLWLAALTLDHAGVAQARADVQLHLGATTALEAVDLELREAQLPGAYLNYLQPWLHGTLGDALETAGRFSGRYRYAAGGDAALRLELRDVDIEDTGQRFGVTALSGVIDWGSDAEARTTELAWQAGSVYRLDLGAARLAVVSRGLAFELREPARIPVLDGALLIDDLALSDPGAEAMRWRFDGVLTPLSLESVCAALDWPRFGGQLSGMIPAVSYADGVLEVGGVLLARAFDGEVTVRNLRLEQPFGRIPRLAADIAIDDLDLEALTGAFEFGRITGRLDGHVRGLRLADWEPVAFEARLATPDDDRSRHRISQKAVDNLSSIGGGVGGALSRSFLGMFEEFPYDRIGLGCTLADGVCRMDGVAPAGNGYYIVKGRLLPPRIDVVGYADRVDWRTLVDRLKSVTLDQAPVVR